MQEIFRFLFDPEHVKNLMDCRNHSTLLNYLYSLISGVLEFSAFLVRIFK